MKLIIDIPEELRERLFNIVNYGMDIATGLENVMIMSIVNGTPIPDNATVYNMEQIRAEIEETQKNTIDWSRSVGLIDALEIIDKYAEQEKYCQECVKADNCNEYGTINCKWKVVKNDL